MTAGDAEQPTLSGLPAPRRRRVRGPVPLADRLPVARVVVERGLAHLDRVFEYAVPATADTSARPGVRVRVRFGGQDVDGVLVERVEVPEHGGELTPLRRVVSPEVVLTAQVRALVGVVARRYAGTVPDVLRLALPPRHARTEQEDWPAPAPRPRAKAHDARPWSGYQGGEAFVRRVAAGEAPRAVWHALPGPPGEDWPDAVAQAVRAAREGGRGALVVAPTGADVHALGAALERAGVEPWSVGRADGWVSLMADDGPADRYRAFLAASRGRADVVVGTRAAAFAPVARLGLVVCWDDAHHLHAEPRAPYPHARDVLAERAHLEGAALLVGGLVRSTATTRWVADGTAHAVGAPRAQVRARTPRVAALTSTELV
ncbi:primosomal protein N', partial [Cellulomonas sp. APG4]|nr:primosomal protein N' [Cellulomonas sp. APG4]